VEQIIDKGIDTGRRQANKAVNSAADVAKDYTTNFTKGSQDVMAQAQEWYRSAEGIFGDLSKRSATVTKRYPTQSLFGAAALGFFLAMLFRRR
jgi:hypothetical protein